MSQFASRHQRVNMSENMITDVEEDHYLEEFFPKPVPYHLLPLIEHRKKLLCKLTNIRWRDAKNHNHIWYLDFQLLTVILRCKSLILIYFIKLFPWLSDIKEIYICCCWNVFSYKKRVLYNNIIFFYRILHHDGWNRGKFLKRVWNVCNSLIKKFHKWVETSSDMM